MPAIYVEHAARWRAYGSIFKGYKIGESLVTEKSFPRVSSPQVVSLRGHRVSNVRARAPVAVYPSPSLLSKTCERSARDQYESVHYPIVEIEFPTILYNGTLAVVRLSELGEGTRLFSVAIGDGSGY